LQLGGLADFLEARRPSGEGEPSETAP
jgi:hypothetical protein